MKILLAILYPSVAIAFSAMAPLSSLLTENAASIADLKSYASSISSNPPSNDIFYLRYLVTENSDKDSDETKSMDDIKALLAKNIAWRENEGKEICTSASNAVAEALNSGGWDNDPVRNAAPHAATINEYITSSQILTTTTSTGDLVYCIRAGKIDDVGLMSKLSIDQMAEFFIYCKEVNAQVANERSMAQNRLVRLVTANDLSGVKLVGGDKSFRTALSAASTQANDLYPNLNGPTLLCELPALLGALVKVFTPLFPAAVRRRLKFEKGVLQVDDLTELVAGASRDKFLKRIDEVVYQGGEW